MDALVGGGFGYAVRERLEAHRAKRLRRRFDVGKRVTVRCRAHLVGRPAWRLARGVVTSSDGEVSWRPLLRRWRSVDLSTATAITVTTTAGRTTLTVASRDRHLRRGRSLQLDQLVATTSSAALVERMLPRLA